jgi:predicted MPP superfamily phosphohydrolase
MKTDRINKTEAKSWNWMIPLMVLVLLCSFLSEDKSGTNTDTWFMVVSDVHTSNDRSKMDKMAKLVSEINEGAYRHVDFLVITGDCVSSFLENRERDHGDPANNRVMKLLNVLEPLEKPFYLVMGNHEYKIDRDKDSDEAFTRTEIDTIEAMWKKYTGMDPYYTFREAGVKYVVLNSMRGKPLERRFDDEQMAWLRNELSSGEPVIMFFHHPVKTDHIRIWAHKRDLVSRQTEPEFMTICGESRKNIRGIFVGHGHFWVKDKLYKEIPVFETASFGDRPEVIGYLVGLDSAEKQIIVTEKIIHKER